MTQQTKNLIKYKRLGKKYFQNREYINSLKYYALAKEIKPEDKDIEISILLGSLAYDLEEEAQAIYEFYSASRLVDKINTYDVVMALITSVESGYESVLGQDRTTQQEFNEIENGISYKDFKDILEAEDGNFKEIFKKIIFSTKVIITQKEDFFEFVEILIKNEYIDMALGYIDSANTVYPSDNRIRELLNLINKIEQLEITDKK
jgi:tetratricopeptide (TPR) repeat protein